MTTPTLEQAAVLDSTARVRVVRAAPGSGKTWLVAELIRRELDHWATTTNGIAALSFTRVGGDEIRRAVGHELTHPHFVGTIDAFLFRYVVRPFLRRCCPTFADPRLVPGEWGAEHWSNYARNQKTTVGQGINLFGCVCIDEHQGEAVVAHKPHPAQPLRRLTGNDLSQVKTAKKSIWERSGQLTHSDAALWASKVLDHQTWGHAVRAEIVRRFPLLIVDELQDTGHFLGKSVRLLLGEAAVRGVLVGDPDQAIYEFNGARPDLFSRFESMAGAFTFPLASSRRCTAAVCDAAKHVKDSGGVIGPAQGRHGRAILVRYGNMQSDIPCIVDAVRGNRSDVRLKVVARGRATVEDLAGRHVETPPSLWCRPLTHIHRAVVLFRQGKNVAALVAARAALELAVFGHEGASDKTLTDSKIDSRDWKALAVRCLLRANAIVTSGTLFDWQTAAGEALDTELIAFKLDPALDFANGKLTPQKRAGWDRLVAAFVSQPGSEAPALVGVPVLTVHGVKGETHDLTVFVCPPTTQPARCPSAVWWSANDEDREEKRIAYVAMTRTQGDLIVCVSDACYQRFIDNRGPFVAAFESMTVEGFVAALAQGVGVPPAPGSDFDVGQVRDEVATIPV
ncbi:MAG: UvrD-helicase domain-containing protein [Phycisphaerales bacterium]|nr:UvrD-helicase domain-containing protein [Phycisphaerales bacterium]